MSANVCFVHKKNTILIEPFAKCSPKLNSIIRNSSNMKWEKRPKMVRGNQIMKSYIVATYENEDDFNAILDILDKELTEDYYFDGHDYYDGYMEVESWLKKRLYED